MVSVSGLRGIVGASLTPEVIARYAGAWGRMAGEKARGRPVIVIGRDGRRGGDAVERIAAGALALAGCDVVRLGVAMTATVGIAVHHREAAGGLVVTASHNPGEWNGLKPITPEGSAPMPEVAARLVEVFHRGDPAWAGASGVGEIEDDRGAAEFHVRRVVEAVARITPLQLIRDRRFRVVVDSVNASGVSGARLLLEELGCNVTHLHNESSGVFPHIPEPTEENLGELCEAVRRAGADIGFAQDPDADRLAIVDSDGLYIGEEYTLVLGAMAVLESMPPREAAHATVAANLSTSRMLDDVAHRFEARVVRTPVGEANVVSGMRTAGATVGGEGNGGVIWPAVGQIRDSLVGMALTLALMARRGAVQEIMASVPRYAIVKRKFPFAPGMEARITQALQGLFPGARADAQDGLRLDFDAPSGGGKAWVHARKSNTEPIFRIIVEAPTKADAAAIADRAVGVAG